jgi:hypothetical protein
VTQTVGSNIAVFVAPKTDGIRSCAASGLPNLACAAAMRRSTYPVLGACADEIFWRSIMNVPICSD